MSLHTVGILQITEDIAEPKANACLSDFVIKELKTLNYTVNKLTVITNSERLVVNELDFFIKSNDIIIVITARHYSVLRGISRLIDQELTSSQELIEYYKTICEPFEHEDILLPVQAKVVFNDDAFPVIHFQRVFILKEKYLRESFSSILKPQLIQYKKPRIFQKTIKINQNGSPIDPTEINTYLNNGQVFGEFSKNILRIESLQLENIVNFIEKIKDKFCGYHLNYYDDSSIWQSIYSSRESHVKHAISTIEHCIDQHGLENIFLSFNGGKDCTVLLHLVLTVIKQKYSEYTQPLFCLYVQSDKPFPEQEEFIHQTKTFYNLRILTMKSGIKDALRQTLEMYPNYKACFMGTRRTDPFSKSLNVFQMTDSNWPQILRANPLLDWHYSDIWDYLLYYKVPYCKLYYVGFTSLGNTVNTTRNPSLIFYDHFEGKEMYLPAYKLLKEVKERNGRSES